MSAKRKRRLMIGSGRVLIAIGLIVLWQLAVELEWIDPIFVAPPTETFDALVRMARDGSLWTHAGETLKVALVGFAMALVVGSVIGFALGLMRTTAELVSPLITILNTLPRIALAPLFVLWFGVGSQSGIMLVFSIVVFIFLTNAYAGARSVDRTHVTLVRLLGASKRQLVTKIVAPTSLPWIIAAARVGFAYAVAGAVVSQMFFGQKGLGYLIVSASQSFDVATVFAAILVTLIFASVLDLTAEFVERRLLVYWQPGV